MENVVECECLGGVAGDVVQSVGNVIQYSVHSQRKEENILMVI